MINGAVLSFQEGMVNSSSDEIDSSDTEGEGFSDTDAGLSTLNIDFKGMWNIAANPHASPFYIVNGQTVENVEVYIDKSKTPRFRVPKLIILTVGNMIAVRDGVKLQFTGRNKGKFYYPGQ